MAKHKIKEPKVDKPKAAPEAKANPTPGLKKAIVDKETLMRLQDEGRLVGLEPNGMATYKEA